MQVLKKDFHSNVYFVALILMAASLPVSKFAMSVMQFVIVFLWFFADFSFSTVSTRFKKNKFFKNIISFLNYSLLLACNNFVNKFKIFFKKKAAIILTSLLLLHVIGLIYTSDYSYALKDMRIKLPLLVFPVILSTMNPIGKKKFNWVMLLFVASVLIGTFISTHVLLKQEFTDIRKISVLISPIRFSLNISIAIFTLIYFIYKKGDFNIFAKILFGIIAAWLIFFQFILESGIGIVILFTLSFLLLIYLVFNLKKIYLKIVIIGTLVLVPIVLFTYVNNIVDDYCESPQIDFNQLEKQTALGNNYKHDTLSLGVEDGKYVGLYLSTNELRTAWNKRSSFDFDGNDQNEQLIKYTIIRFLTSKDYRKDAEGVNKLTDKEIKAIERGIANINYIESPNLKTRISKIILGYNNLRYSYNPNGNSIMQRIEYWKASLGIIKQNIVFGVGTGDIRDVFQEQYEKMNSPLEIENRLRSHNQFLSIFIVFGIFGFVWFLFTLLYPPIKTKKMFEYFYFMFFVIAIVSMLTEDTIESQAGVTFFAFFNSFFLFSRKTSLKS